jgi:hypothetical protein
MVVLFKHKILKTLARKLQKLKAINGLEEIMKLGYTL